MTMASTISKAAALLRAGGLVAFPTETVYGLGADATNDAAVTKIFAAKQRPSLNPLISHVADLEAASRLGVFSKDATKLAEALWPGPLTIVVERQRDCPISLLCSSGLSSVALRVPAHALALQLIAATGLPLAAPSANRSGRISPTTADHVRGSLGDHVDMILDGGPAAIGLESTVVRFMDDVPYLLRAGGATRETLEDILGRKLIAPAQVVGGFHSPGQLESHYAPRARMRLNADAPNGQEVYLGFAEYVHGPWTLSRAGHLQEAAANLFKMLHAIDDTSPQRIAVAPIPMSGLGEAINDRLMRAAAPRPDA
jgi:L-threonylcarbamoyladenylate synthase